MADTTITAIIPGRFNNILEARIYRKWSARGPPGTTEQTFCCMLIDRQGNAIQGNMDYNNADYFNSKTKIGMVYRIIKFFTEDTKTYLQTLENPMSLRFGRVTDFDLLPDMESEFPKHYFEFVSYNQLESRIPYIDQHTGKMVFPVLTDYLGRIHSISDLIPSGDANTGQRYRRKVEIESLDGNVVELTMWNELAKQFDKHEIQKSTFPIILAISSCRVKKYRDVQLVGTSATHFYTNPKIQVVADARRMFKQKYNQNLPLQVVNTRFADTEQEKNRNRETLRTLLQQNPATYKNVRFTCEATIVTIVSNKSWNYLSCNQCNKASFEVEGSQICEDHGEQVPPPYKYNFKATVGDGTGIAEFTFFNDVGYKIIGSSCPEVRARFRPTAPNQLPPELTSIVGQTHIFQIYFPANSQQGAGKFTVQDILDIPKPTAYQIGGSCIMRQEVTTVSNMGVHIQETVVSGIPGITKEVAAEETNVVTQSSMVLDSKDVGLDTQSTATPGTPPTDIIEQIAETIVQTIPRQNSKENKDTAEIPTSSEPKPHGAKRSLLKDLSVEAKKKKED